MKVGSDGRERERSGAGVAANHLELRERIASVQRVNRVDEAQALAWAMQENARCATALPSSRLKAGPKVRNASGLVRGLEAPQTSPQPAAAVFPRVKHTISISCRRVCLLLETSR
jgi:hypothetical protein